MSVQTEINRISQNVANTYAVLEAMGCEMPSEQNSDNLAPTAGTSKVVRYDAQTLTEAQKTQARKNIGVPTQTSQLTNDSNFVTKNEIPNETDVLEMGFVKEDDAKSYTDNKVADLKATLNQVEFNFAEGKTVEEQIAWLDENGDESKVYLLEDGYIYAFMKSESSGVAYTNRLLNSNGELDLKLNKRWSRSGAKYSDANGYVSTAKIPVTSGQTIRINRALKFLQGGYARIHYFNSSGECLSSDGTPDSYYKLTESNGQTSWKVGENTSGANHSWHTSIATMIVIFNVSDGTVISINAVSDLILTIDEPIEETTVEKYQWTNTGRAFLPADYEGRVIELENEVNRLNKKLKSTNVGTLSACEVFAPSPQLPADGSQGSDFNADKTVIKPQHIYDYIEPLLSKYPNYITKETVGKDQSGTYDWNRYICCRRYYNAWIPTGKQVMYAWVNGSTVIYSTSVSPRIGDTLYTTAYVGTSYAKVTAVDNANQTRTVNGLVFARDKSKDIIPTMVFTETYYSPNYAFDYPSSIRRVYNESCTSIAHVSSFDGETMTDNKGNTYIRYPLGDRDNKFKRIPAIVIGGSEHGSAEPVEPAIIASRMIKDLCECVNTNNPMLNLLKNNYMIVFCPIINPWGFANQNSKNSNGVNLDRNYDTPAWGQDTATQDVDGAYGGSEAETQHFMNTLVESKAKIAMANHGLGDGIDSTVGEAISAGLCHWMLGRDNSKYDEHLKSIGAILSANYNLAFVNYGEAPPETWAKTRSYIDWIGAEGGAVEMQAREGFVLAGEGQQHTARILEANYTLLLQFLYMLIDKQ